jgi:hypothetical protein
LVITEGKFSVKKVFVNMKEMSSPIIMSSRGNHAAIKQIWKEYLLCTKTMKRSSVSKYSKRTVRLCRSSPPREVGEGLPSWTPRIRSNRLRWHRLCRERDSWIWEDHSVDRPHIPWIKRQSSH